jgi:hypothetical protein
MAVDITFWKRVKYSFYSTLVFLLLTNPMTYAFTQSMFQGVTMVRNGVLTSTGYFFHAFLFFLTILGIMMFPKD